MTARQLHRVEPVTPRQRDTDDRPPVAAWMDDAPCSLAADLFFSDDKNDIDGAKRICTTQCSLDSRISCMDYAFENGLEYGVWGGISRAERVEKVCSSCEESKVLDEYQRRKDAPDGYRSVCKACIADAHRREISPENRDAAVVTFSEAQERRAAELDARVRQYAALLAELGRDEAIRTMKITKRTAQRYTLRLREQQEVAA